VNARQPPRAAGANQAAEGPSGQYGGSGAAAVSSGAAAGRAAGRAKGRTFDSVEACHAEASA
jgi:hypothetical protein